MKSQDLDNDSDLSDRQSASQPPVGYWIGLIVVFSIPFWFGVHLFCGGVEPPHGNKKQLEILLGGVPTWNEWRAAQPDARIALDDFDLSDGDLRGVNLNSAFIGRCDMAGADLSGSSLVNANAGFSDMAGANLSGADAREAQFRFADLSNSNLSRCNLTGANLDNATLIGANLSGAEFSGANLIFANLEEVEHWRDIKDIRCANIYGVSAPRGFREWALNRGALEYDRDSYQDWIAACVDTTEARFPSQLLKLTFPEPPELSREYPESDHPDFPESDANKVTRFWNLLRDDFSAMYRSGDPGASVERLEGYLQVRDAWLDSGSLTKCILAATITMAIDEYLTILIQPGKGLSEPDFNALRAIATRNDLPPRKLLVAFDASRMPEQGGRPQFADVCAENCGRDFYDCWEQYLAGLGMQYQLLEWSENVSVRFIVTKPDLTNKEKAGTIVTEQFVSGGMNGWRPVYVLHTNDDFWMLLFLAYVLDEQEVRQWFWNVAVPVVEEGRTLLVGDEKSAVAAFKKSGKRWLSTESIHDEAKDEGQYFNRQTNYASRRGGFFDSGDDETPME